VKESLAQSSEKHKGRLSNKELEIKPFVLECDGQGWLVRNPGHNDPQGVRIPDDIAKVIVVAIKARERVKAGRYNERDGAMLVPTVFAQVIDVAYCHRTLRYILKLPIYEADSADIPHERAYLGIGGFDFKPAASYDELASHLAAIDPSMPCVGRVISHISPHAHHDHERYPYNAHSFLVLGKDGGGDYLCFEKCGSTYPFRIATLRDLCEEYLKPNYEFGFRSVADMEPELEALRSRAA
jgi:hypothetical protein